MKLVTLLSALLVQTWAISGLRAEDKKIWAKSILGQKAPELQVETWLTDRPDTQGKFVLIDFWATWCPPCRAAIPELNAFQKQFAGKLVVIGITDESKAKVDALQDVHPEYAVATDPLKRTYKELQITGIPHIIIMDPSGTVRWEGFPFLQGHELSASVVADIIAKYSTP